MGGGWCGWKARLPEGGGLGWEGEGRPDLEDGPDGLRGGEEAQAHFALRPTKATGDVNEVEAQTFEFGVAERLVVIDYEDAFCHLSSIIGRFVRPPERIAA